MIDTNLTSKRSKATGVFRPVRFGANESQFGILAGNAGDSRFHGNDDGGRCVRSFTTPSGATSIKIPSSFDDVQDIYGLPVKVNGDRVVTLGDLAEINFTFEDRVGTARFNGEATVALQVVKRKGFNLIDTVAEVKEVVEAATEEWPDELKQAVEVRYSNDQSHVISSMVSQLEGSVITAIALVMIVVLASLGMRSALLVGFAIPTSFLLTFALFAVTSSSSL